MDARVVVNGVLQGSLKDMRLFVNDCGLKAVTSVALENAELLR